MRKLHHLSTIINVHIYLAYVLLIPGLSVAKKNPQISQGGAYARPHFSREAIGLIIGLFD